MGQKTTVNSFVSTVKNLVADVKDSVRDLAMVFTPRTLAFA